MGGDLPRDPQAPGRIPGPGLERRTVRVAGAAQSARPAGTRAVPSCRWRTGASRGPPVAATARRDVPARRGAATGGPEGHAFPASSTWSSRTSASSPTRGYSKTTPAGSRSPVAVRSRLRSSTEARESKPRSRNVWPWSIPPLRPRTDATSVLRSRTRASCRRSSGSWASWSAQEEDDAAPRVTRSTTRRPGGGTRSRNIPGTVSRSARPRSAARSSRTGTRWAWSRVTARSKRARPSSLDSPATPARLIRARSTSARCPVIPLDSAHRPQASEVAVRPVDRRRAASPSRNAFAAA